MWNLCWNLNKVLVHDMKRWFLICQTSDRQQYPDYVTIYIHIYIMPAHGFHSRRNGLCPVTWHSQHKFHYQHITAWFCDICEPSCVASYHRRSKTNIYTYVFMRRFISICMCVADLCQRVNDVWMVFIVCKRYLNGLSFEWEKFEKCSQYVIWCQLWGC